MRAVKPGDRVRVTRTVYLNPLAKVGILARPGEIATVLEWVNAGTMRVYLQEDVAKEFLLRSDEGEPL
jgi:hypothetical protein